MNKADLLLHPVRSRIVGATAGRSLTTAQLAQVLRDVPLPTLYRQIRILADAQILKVTEIKAARGTEKTYTLAEHGGQLDPNEIKTPEGQLAALTNFTNLIVHNYRAYLGAGGEEPLRAGMTALNLTEEEHQKLTQTIRALIAPLSENPPGEGRTRRLLSIIDLPDFEPSNEENQ